jgi:hypothetical protein
MSIIHWLHVHENGHEQRFAAEPEDILTLRVETIERDDSTVTERTWTKRVQPPDSGSFKVVEPRGVGWAEAGNDSGSTVWMRVREI